MKLYVVHHHMYHAPSIIRGVFDNIDEAMKLFHKIGEQLKTDFNDDGFDLFLEEIELNEEVK